MNYREAMNAAVAAPGTEIKVTLNTPGKWNSSQGRTQFEIGITAVPKRYGSDRHRVYKLKYKLNYLVISNLAAEMLIRAYGGNNAGQH